MPRPWALLLLSAAVFGPATPLAAQRPPQAVALGTTDLVADSEGTEIAVQHASRRWQVAAPVGARAHSLAQLDAGWLLAGTAPAADGGREIWLRRGDVSSVSHLPPPAGRTGSLRHGPVVVAEAGEVAGLAWLEGDARSRFEIRFAPWTGAGFGPAERVAPPGRGSQLALSGARLGDGRVLLVWAGFDGEDDEVWASLGTAGGWSPPLRVAADNRVPDITPAVLADATGALVAWSRFDGSEYEVVIARFDGRRFLPPRPVAAPGSVYPTFVDDGSRRGVLFVDARSGGWALRELDANGGPGRLGRFGVRGEGERPLVRLSERGVDWQLAQAREATAWE
jgi:hypothetical protein